MPICTTSWPSFIPINTCLRNLETTTQLCKNQTKFHMATSKVLSIALFVLLGLSMCSATRKPYDNRDSDLDQDGYKPEGENLPVPNEKGFGGFIGVGFGGFPRLPGGFSGVGSRGQTGGFPGFPDVGYGGFPGVGVGSRGQPGGFPGVASGGQTGGFPGFPRGFPGVGSRGQPGGFPGFPGVGYGGFPGVGVGSRGQPGGFPGVASGGFPGLPGGFPGVESRGQPGGFRQPGGFPGLPEGFPGVGSRGQPGGFPRVGSEGFPGVGSRGLGDEKILGELSGKVSGILPGVPTR